MEQVKPEAASYVLVPLQRFPRVFICTFNDIKVHKKRPKVSIGGFTCCWVSCYLFLMGNEFQPFFQKGFYKKKGSRLEHVYPLEL